MQAPVALSVFVALGGASWGCSTVLGLEDPAARDGGGLAEAGAPDSGPCTAEACLDCGPGARACGDRCVTLDDPLHCGRCGHNCLGGACVDDRCQPVVLASGLTRATDITVTDDAVFLLGMGSGENKVIRAPKDPIPCHGNDTRCIVPTPKEAFASIPPGGGWPSALATDGVYLYAFVHLAGLMKRPLAAPALEPFTLVANTPAFDALHLAATPSAVFATTRTVDWLVELRTNGLQTRAQAEDRAPDAFGLLPWGERDMVAWIAAPLVSDVRPGLHHFADTAVPRVCFGNNCALFEGTVRAVATSKSDLFVAYEDGAALTVGRIPAGTARCSEPACPEPLVTGIDKSQSGQTIVRLAADGDHVYWTSLDAEATTVYRTSLAAPCHDVRTGSCEIVLNASLAFTMALDASSLYVSRRDATGLSVEVVRVAK